MDAEHQEVPALQLALAWGFNVSFEHMETVGHVCKSKPKGKVENKENRSHPWEQNPVLPPTTTCIGQM